MIKIYHYRFLLLFAFLILGLQSDCLELPQYETMRVAKVDVILENLVEGTPFDSNLIRARLQTKTGNLFSQNEFDQDLKRLAEEYDRIEPSLDYVNGELYIVLRIWPKPCIHEIRFCGNEKVKSKKLQQEFGIESGSLFNREDFIAAFNKIKTYYVKQGYFEAEIDYNLLPVVGCNEIDIEICIKEGRAGKIQQIQFCGISDCEQKDLLNVIVTKKYQFLFSWLTNAGTYNEDMIEHDRMAILNYFQNQGYLDSTVEIKVIEACSSDRIIIEITVDKGQCYYFGSITLTGNCICTRGALFDLFQCFRGQPFSPEKLRCTAKAIRDFYGSKGYIEAIADYQVSLHEGEPIYDIAFTIEEGDPYRVGLIKVFGNECTQNRIILNECLLVPGDIFDVRKLEGTETRLRSMGYFSNVNVYAVRTTEEDVVDGQYRDVHIEVEETDTGHVGIFFGFSTQDSLFGGVELCEQNFNVRGITRAFSEGASALRGNGEFFNVKASIGTVKNSYLLQWTKPYFMDTPWTIGFDFEQSNNTAISSDYDIDTLGFNLNAIYPFNEFLRAAWHYRLRNTCVTIHGIPSDEVRQAGEQSGLVSASGISFVYDDSDHPRRPTSGLRSRFDTEVAGIGGDFNFFKVGYLNTYYMPIGCKGVLKFRADAIFIVPFGGTTANNLPLSERLFLGGETTVRGYRPYILGPRLTRLNPKGGISSYLISEEYQYSFFPRIDGFIFVDAGYVSDKEFTIGRPQVSCGGGFRIEVMPNVPMTFGVGCPICADPDIVKKFFFAIGGQF